ncbi:MAG: chemotaxis protein CheW [Oceanicoccus sp.]
MIDDVHTTTAANELATLLIPMVGRQLVLPNVTVAEIIPFIEPVERNDMPVWFLGTFSWRNIDIPLISFEAINQDTEIQAKSDRRIAVLNGLVDTQRLPFCGIVTAGVPRLMRVSAGEVATDEHSVPGPSESARVLVSGEPAIIPDIDYIQEQVLNVM